MVIAMALDLFVARLEAVWYQDPSRRCRSRLDATDPALDLPTAEMSTPLLNGRPVP
jgi:hypothetical protein